MAPLPHHPGLRHRAVVAQGVQHEQGIGQAARMLHALGDHRRGGQVEGDEVGFAAGQEVTDQAVQVERPGAAEGGQVERLERIEAGAAQLLDLVGVGEVGQ